MSVLCAWCLFSCFVLRLFQSLVPSARPMKLATVMGASFSKSLQVRRPMVVSMTAVGPVGTTGGLIWGGGVGGSGSCGEVGVVCWAGGGGGGGAGVHWAWAPAARRLRT